MVRQQQVEIALQAEAPPEVVWRLLSDVTTWTSWAGFTEAEYERPGDPPPHGLGAVRRFRAGPLRSTERVLVFEPPFRLSYDYNGTLPLRNYRADVVLRPSGSGTRITWSASFSGRPPVPGRLLRPLVRKVLNDVAGRLAAAAASAAG